MKSDTGYLLAGGLGIGLGLFSVENWFIVGLIGICIIVLVNLFINSELLRSLINSPDKEGRSFSVPKYIIANFFINSTIAAILFIVIKLIISFLLR